ncbi:MAG: Fe-S cluster assembly ATPase SufC [Firmicutes bacterium]|jgi:Fe-S cluster assembly ATP-binding protein|uniref:Fe-S cluster assembly ATPase SufC n=1 Tax=Sulfobacillus benefaciens TaxID=453960 RepID=A0A2T2XBS0_9FIRM|nr:Fe-S cluster assembly ATPase SufC [Bacillota bacterium]MCL5014758.1 Fe-S cluster assembly ATPase SufC [Bacillota bacterium]PSR31920.1 MAG: Fe-S cluster assembly ATPase SufC [Sulfobacillus benefaciens]HBQ94619.1 Fe-S cluster assembly ATPase SufC [Sulfobacillus sp.]
MPAPVLEIKDLHVSIDDKPILKGVNLTVKGGEFHAVMGPNGTGKTSLAQTLMGHPRYQVTRGEVLLDGQDVLKMKTDIRAKAGLFLAMQYPSEISGVTTANFLRTAINARRGEGNQISLKEFRDKLDETMRFLDMDPKFANRYVNEGFSGGEKKRNEILQMLMLEPRIAILDEIDSGLDIDAIKVVAKGVQSLRSPDFGVLLITHYQRILSYLKPDVVHIMIDGRVVKSGDFHLAEEMEVKGYEWVRNELLNQVP